MRGGAWKRGQLVVLAGVILAALVAQIALAGGGASNSGSIASLQRQINELKAQVASGATAKAATKKSKRGPPGPPGPAGPPGALGATGATGATGSAPACQGNGSGDQMVAAGAVCIDKYEASVWSSPTGGTQYGVSSNDYPADCTATGQGCKAGTAGQIYARSVPGVEPSAFITYFQAQQALANVGKRLPSNAEWQQAAAGTPNGNAPDNGTTDCNTNFAGTIVNTGSRSACVSNWGAYDMVGNVWEWVADWVPASTTCTSWGTVGSFSSTDSMCLSGASTTATGPGALVRGGGFGANLHGGFGGGVRAGPFAVFGDVRPSDSSLDFGFRGAR